MVSGVEAALHGRGRDLESLEKEDVDESDDYDREDNRIEPVKRRIVLFALFVFLLPEKPLDFLRDIKVKDDDKTEQPPPTSEPDHP